MPNVKKIRNLNLPGTPWATSAFCGMTFSFIYFWRKVKRDKLLDLRVLIVYIPRIMFTPPFINQHLSTMLCITNPAPTRFGVFWHHLQGAPPNWKFFTTRQMIINPRWPLVKISQIFNYKCTAFNIITDPSVMLLSTGTVRSKNLLKKLFYNVLLTVHHAMILGNCPTWRTNSFKYIYLFIVLYMFRACNAHHQEK